jgi:hypothetical protein
VELNREIVRTSQRGWLEALARVYKHRRTALLIDDADFGIDPTSQTLFEMARRAGLSKQELAAVCVALGMSAVGIGMIVVAVFDPEPTSKLGLLVGGGAVCVLGGGFAAIRVLTKHKPPNIKATLEGIEISWT